MMSTGMTGSLRMAAFAAWFSIAGYAQTDSHPAFEVVSVKAIGPNIAYGPSKPGASVVMGLRYSDTRVNGNSQIPAMIEEAFSVKWFEIVGPDWLPSECYEIAATMPAGTTRESARLMLRTMLAERFGLRFHREQRDLPVYALIEAKGGARLHPVDPEQAKERIVETPMGPRKGIFSFQGRGQYIATAIALGDFADQITSLLDRPVVNQTNLQGTYGIELQWTPGDAMELISVIGRQLGLKLESRKLPHEML